MVRAGKGVRVKYRNQPTTVDGIQFDSKAEARRWQELRLMERAGEIRDLERQPLYVLAPPVRFADSKRATPSLRYWADFRYFDVRANREVCEDVKGIQTQAFRLKRHLMKSVHGIDVLVTK